MKLLEILRLETIVVMEKRHATENGTILRLETIVVMEAAYAIIVNIMSRITPVIKGVQMI